MQNAAANGAGMGLGLGIQLISLVAFCLIIGYPIYVMAQKTNQQNAWMAFVPILNIYMMTQIAGKEAWWVILCLIPCIGIVPLVIVWMAIAERMGKPSWVGLLILIPGIGGLLVPWYLALG